MARTHLRALSVTAPIEPPAVLAAPATRNAATRSRERLYLGAILVSVVALHAASLSHAFFLDDYVYVGRVHDLSLKQAGTFFTSATLDQSMSGVWWTPRGMLPFYRPLGQVTFLLDHAVWGLRPAGYHLTNLLLHLLCVVLTWALARRLFVLPRDALATAAVFGLQPVHSEAVIWISGRFDLLVCACILASTLCYLKWARDEGARMGWAGAAVLFFVAGLGCKETALVWPAALIALELAIRPSRRSLRRLGPLVVVLGIILLAYLNLRAALFGTPLGRLPPPYGLDTSSPLAAGGQILWHLAQYLLDLILSIHLDPFFLSGFWQAHPALFALALTLALIMLAGGVILARSRVALIGLGWLALFTAPTLLSMAGERNIYLASVGLSLVTASLFGTLLTRAQAAETRRAMYRRTRRVALAASVAVALWIGIDIFKQTVVGRFAAVSEKGYHDLLVLSPHPPLGTRFYVIHQNPLNSIGFTQAIRFHYRRSDLSGCALSISPTLGFSCLDSVEATGDRRLRITRTDGVFLDSFIERFYLLSQPPSELPASARDAGLVLLDPPRSFNHLTQLEFQLPASLHSPEVEVFYWDNHRIVAHRDVVRFKKMHMRRVFPSGQVNWFP